MPPSPPGPPGNQSRRFPPSKKPTGPPSATGAEDGIQCRLYIVTFFIAFVLIKTSKLSLRKWSATRPAVLFSYMSSSGWAWTYEVLS